MHRAQQHAVAAVMKHYSALRRSKKYRDFFSWSPVRKRFTLDNANAFFLGVILDQGQFAERAWEGGNHLVQTHFKGQRGFWKEVLDAHTRTVKKICTSGYEGKAYALLYCTNKFPPWLRAAAGVMLEKYQGDPRNIWSVTPEDVSLIYDRFLEFDGIGDALAKMAQFILVRNYGIAGGKQNQSKMSVKPDVLVRRVLARVGITGTEKLGGVLGTLSALNLRRPADFDASLWVVGREFCFKTSPSCAPCPLRSVCAYSIAQQGAPADRPALASLRRAGLC